MLEVYRVLKAFDWEGRHFGPRSCRCGCPSGDGACTGQSGTECRCHNEKGHCPCVRAKADYAGDVWVVDGGHPRKEIMLANRFATGDPSLPSGDAVKDDPVLKRLIGPAREPVAARK